MVVLGSVMEHGPCRSGHQQVTHSTTLQPDAEFVLCLIAPLLFGNKRPSNVTLVPLVETSVQKGLCGVKVSCCWLGRAMTMGVIY